MTCSCVAVAEGDVTLTLAVVPEMAPVVQLLVYSMLPSETVIAHSMNFPTEKCFRNKVCGGVWHIPSNCISQTLLSLYERCPVFPCRLYHTWSNGICVCQVSVEFSPSNAVPGEENTLHLSARPGSLCGLGAVGVMEPGKRLDADKVTRLTEVNSGGTTVPTVLVVLGITTSDYSRHGVDLFTVGSFYQM